jgi:hypothetical protein
MDKVLSRKMFRQKYLESQTPKGFQKGGLGSLDITDEEVKKELNLPDEKPVVPEKPEETTEGSSVEKAFSNLLGLENTTGTLTRSQRLLTIMAPIQAALLNATQNPGESKTAGTLRALGLGLTQLGPTMQKIAAQDLAAREVGAKEVAAQAKAAEAGTKGIKTLTKDQKRTVGINEFLPASGTVNAQGDVTKIVKQPSDKDVRDYNSLRKSIMQITEIENIIKSGEAGTGYLESSLRYGAEVLGIPSEQTELKMRLDTLRKDYIQAMRGAAVGPKEEETFDTIVPDAKQGESEVLTKLEVMKKSLNQAKILYETTGYDETTGIFQVDALKPYITPTYDISSTDGEINLNRVK